MNKTNITFAVNFKLVEPNEYRALCKWFKEVTLEIPSQKYAEEQISINLEQEFLTFLN